MYLYGPIWRKNVHLGFSPVNFLIMNILCSQQSLAQFLLSMMNIHTFQKQILESHVTIGKNTCSDVGVYEVSSISIPLFHDSMHTMMV